MDTTIVFAGGPGPSPAARAGLEERLRATAIDRVVAADSGLEVAERLGVEMVPGRDVVLGDMDSVDPDRLAEAARSGVRVERFPTDKDATDLELALDDACAHASDGDRVVVVGTTAGRFDHVVAAVSTLAAGRYDRLEREAWLGVDVVHVVRGRRLVHVAPDATFSLVPIHGPAVGVTTVGARWELHGETLEPGTSRGVSNRSVGGTVEVGVQDGTLLVVVPGPEADGVTP